MPWKKPQLAVYSAPVLLPKHWAQTVYIGMLPHKDTYSRPGQVTVLPNFLKTEKVKKNEKAEKYFSDEEQDNPQEKNPK